MTNLKFFTNLLFGRKLFPNLEPGTDDLYPEGLRMGTLFIGRPGTGKTSSLAYHIYNYVKAFPENACFVLDWSGSFTDTFLHLTSLDTAGDFWDRKLIYDDLGNPDVVIPMPEFSEEYGSAEEQVQRVAVNLAKLAPELVADAPFLAGLGLREIAPQIFRLLSAIEIKNGESWQATETKRLLVDMATLRLALKQFGGKVPEAKWFLERVFAEYSAHERELRSYALMALLGAIEPKETRARIGYPKPGWTPKEAIQKGKVVIVNGARLINRTYTQHYLFTQVYSLIMQEINRRTPGDPNDKPVGLVMDEVYSLLSIPGMAQEVGMLAPLYRSRKLELYVVLQSLSQLAPVLKEQIWSLGNIVSFGVSNFNEAYELAQQLFPYKETTVKAEAKVQYQQPVFEPDRGQYLKIANWIQRLGHRECIIKRFVSEQQQDPYIRHVTRTKEFPLKNKREDVTAIKKRLLESRGVPVTAVVKLINERKLSIKTAEKPPQI